MGVGENVRGLSWRDVVLGVAFCLALDAPRNAPRNTAGTATTCAPTIDKPLL